MEKFDDFLNNKIKTEDEKFIVPDKVNNRIEDTLRNLDLLVEKENDIKNIKKFNLNRKYISIAAMFILLIGIGVRVINPAINQESKNLGKSENLREGNTTKEVAELKETDLSKLSNNDKLINLDKINIVEIRSLSKDIYITTTEENEIGLVLNYINSLYLSLVKDKTMDNYEYLIKLSGDKEIEIIIQNNLIAIDGQLYISNYNLQEQFRVIFEQL